MVLLGRIQFESQLLNSGNCNDSSEMRNLSVALSSHGLRLGLFIFSLPFSDVTSLGFNLGLEEVSTVSSGCLLSLLVELSGTLLVVLDGSLADSLFGFEFD